MVLQLEGSNLRTSEGKKGFSEDRKSNFTTDVYANDCLKHIKFAFLVHTDATCATI